SRLESRLAARTGGGTTPSNSKIHSGLCGAADGRRRSLDNGSSQCEELLQIFITHTANAGIDIFGVQQLSPRLVFPYPCDPPSPADGNRHVQSSDAVDSECGQFQSP